MSSTLILRAGPEAFDPAFYLLQRFFAEEGFATAPEDLRENLRAFLRDERYAVFLAYRNNETVGVATLSTAISIELGRMAEIDDLYVLPEARNLGIAKRLIETARHWLRLQGGDYVQVTLTPEGEAKHGLARFYTHLGFHPTGRTSLAQTLNLESWDFEA